MYAERDFVVAVRAIFDSKYNEFMFYDNPRMYSNFPEFVYGWLSTSLVDSASRKVREINDKDKIDIEMRRLTFYNSLINPRL